ncbi:MAG: cytoplasmic protein [Methanoculleus sp. SDB]|nr:MAG: cytoplasmic protein [Methanoculleus sp. SDB]
MARKFVTPTAVVSRCIEFDHCRCNGDMIRSHIVDRLKEFVDFIPVCPEVEIGLGVPRDPIRIVRKGGAQYLVQPATGRDVSDEMARFAESFLDTLPHIDGFILKNKSPSCGMKEVRVYAETDKGASIGKTDGFFARSVLKRFPGMPVEDEGRLRNMRIRDHFLTRLYTFSEFRTVRASGSVGALVRFHSENKLLLLAHNQRQEREMGRTVANHDGLAPALLMERYGEQLARALATAPRYTANVNALLHAGGHFRDRLTREEKAFFLDAVEKYREGRISICAPKNILKSWIVRFGEDRLDHQTFFATYPDRLMELDPADLDRGRDLWT